MGAQADGALNLRAAQLARPGAALGAIGPVAVNTAIAGNLPVDRRPMTAQAAGNLADAKPRLHQAAQAASLLKFKVRVLRSHGDPGHSRCRTWFASLAPSASLDVARIHPDDLPDVPIEVVEATPIHEAEVLRIARFGTAGCDCL